jgi:hypothetical protein
VKVDIHQISGSVEIAQILVLQMLLSILYPAEVLLFKNNLKEVEIIYKK